MVPTRVPRAHRLQTRLWPRPHQLQTRVLYMPTRVPQAHRFQIQLWTLLQTQVLCVPIRVPQAHQLRTGSRTPDPLALDPAPDPRRCSLVENLVPCVSALVQISHHIPYEV